MAQSIFECGKGRAIRRRCHINANRDVRPGRGHSCGMTEVGKLYKRPTANDRIKGTYSRREHKAIQNGCTIIRTNERPSDELIALAIKRSAKFDRY